MGFSGFLCASTLLHFVFGLSVMADNTAKVLFEFTRADAAKDWQMLCRKPGLQAVWLM
jgi:hypothetical protein